MHESAPDPRPGEAIHEAIDLLQEKWTLHIVRSLLDGPKGFNQLGREIGGCNPTTLTHRLNRLEVCGLIGRDTSRARRCYALTPSGQALGTVIEAIGGWARIHLAAKR